MQGRKSLISLVFILIAALTIKIPAAVGHPPQQSNLQVITPENTDRLAQIGHLGNGRAVSAQFSADGETLAVLGTLGIWLYDQSDPTVFPRLLESTHGGPHSMAVHPIENTLAMGNRDGTISFWDIESGAEISTMEAHQTPVRLLTYNADGTRLASAGGGVFDQEQAITVDDVAKLWDTTDGREIAMITDEDGSTPFQLIFTPDNSVLVINFERSCSDAALNYLRFFDALTGLPVEDRNWNAYVDQFFVLSHDGTRVAIGGLYGSELAVWDIVSQATLFQYTDDESWFIHTKISFSLDDSLLIAVREDFYRDKLMPEQVKIWDYANNQVIDTLEYNEIINDALFSPNGKTLVVITSGGFIHYYDFNSGHIQDTTTVHADFEGFSAKIAVHPNEPIIAVLEKQRAWHDIGINVDFWDYSTSRLLTTRSVNHATDIAINSDGQLVFSDKSESISFLDMEDLNGEKVTIEVGLPDILSVALNPTNEHEVAVGNLYTWQLGLIEDNSSYTPISSSTDDGNFRYAIAFSPNGKWMAQGAGYKGPALYELIDSGAVALPLVDSPSYIYAESVAFSPDSKMLVTGGKYAYGCSRAGNVQVWSVPDLELLATLEDHTEEVTAVVFSPDGSLLASSSEDGTIHIRRSDTYEILAVLEEHLGYGANSIVFTPDGRLLISAGDDGTIRLWGIPE